MGVHARCTPFIRSNSPVDMPCSQDPYDGIRSSAFYEADVVILFYSDVMSTSALPSMLRVLSTFGHVVRSDEVHDPSPVGTS